MRDCSVTGSLLPVVVAEGSDAQFIALHDVDHPVFGCDPPRPVARVLMPERLRLASPLERCPRRFADERVDPPGDFRVFALPAEVVGAGLTDE
jgi:hypothetical protein